MINSIKADQPVHCIRGQIYGEWTFYVDQETQIVNLFDIKEACTH